MKKFITLFVSVAVCQLAGIVGSLFTAPAIPTWYAALKKPSFNPPSWLFGPVWITLYTMMGVSLYLIWQKRGEIKLAWPAIIFFLIHLAVNASWSIIFFGQKNIIGALILIVALWFMIVASIFLFYKINKTAAYLLVPYLLWVSFASILNYSLWRLN
ncbi:MAG: TspO/MBR family protein [Parcubacteria group bacterium ADurb.Bin316]|nr:MAG: TspO/MBR family protein [Parcubacteria group bacterium ADurb.Bin316]HOZ56042.1 tryptophan-rich sensory protein [bacterium]